MNEDLLDFGHSRDFDEPLGRRGAILILMLLPGPQIDTIMSRDDHSYLVQVQVMGARPEHTEAYSPAAKKNGKSILETLAALVLSANAIISASDVSRHL